MPAVAQVELVAEKLRTLVQRAQPRDLFDLHLYLTESGWHLDPAELRRAVDVKLSRTRHRPWKPGVWRQNLDAIRVPWDATMSAWVDPSRLPPVGEVIEEVARGLRSLRLEYLAPCSCSREPAVPGGAEQRSPPDPVGVDPLEREGVASVALVGVRFTRGQRGPADATPLGPASCLTPLDTSGTLRRPVARPSEAGA